MSNKKMLIILGILFIFIFWGLGTHFGQSSKTASKGNVSSDRAGSAANEASTSAGLGGTPSFGDDPCARQSKNIPIPGKDIKIKSPGEATGMPGKPVANVGKQGQLMEGEEAECKYPQEMGLQPVMSNMKEIRLPTKIKLKIKNVLLNLKMAPGSILVRNLKQRSLINLRISPILKKRPAN